MEAEVNSVIQKIKTHPKVTGDTVISWLNEAKNDWISKKERNKPDDIVVGDVILFSINNKAHPCVVFHTTDTHVMAIVLSSQKEKGHNLRPVSGSRIYKNSYFTTTVITVEKEQALRSWASLFDVTEDLRQAIWDLRKYYNENLTYGNIPSKKKEEKKSEVNSAEAG